MIIPLASRPNMIIQKMSKKSSKTWEDVGKVGWRASKVAVLPSSSTSQPARPEPGSTRGASAC